MTTLIMAIALITHKWGSMYALQPPTPPGFVSSARFPLLQGLE